MKKKAPGLLDELSWEKRLVVFVVLLFRCFGAEEEEEEEEELNCSISCTDLFSVHNNYCKKK